MGAAVAAAAGRAAEVLVVVILVVVVVAAVRVVVAAVALAAGGVAVAVAPQTRPCPGRPSSSPGSGVSWALKFATLEALRPQTPCVATLLQTSERISKQEPPIDSNTPMKCRARYFRTLRSIPELLIYHPTIPERTLQPPLNSQDRLNLVGSGTPGSRRSEPKRTR